MKLNLNGVEIELPNNAKVDVSKDGKHVKIDLPESDKVVEKIRVVEVPGPGTDRIVERIKVVETEKPCTRPHYPTYPYNPWITYTTGGSQIIGGSTTIVPNTVTYGTTSGGLDGSQAWSGCSNSYIANGNENITLTSVPCATN